LNVKCKLKEEDLNRGFSASSKFHSEVSEMFCYCKN